MDDIVVTPSDVAVRSVHAMKATATQWAVVRSLQSLVQTRPSYCASTFCRPSVIRIRHH